MRPLLWIALTAAVCRGGPLDVGQPIPFSHKQHVQTAHLKCSDCHHLAASGEVFSIPKGKMCMSCHTRIGADTAAIQDLKSYIEEKQPVPWVRVYEIASFVDVNHKTHLDAGAGCQTCHGPVATRDRLVREIDLSMGMCVSCHVQHGAKTGCHTCHDLDQ